MDALLTAFDRQFAAIDKRSRELLALIPDGRLFERPPQAVESLVPLSCGECILRSGAMVEKTFGGITTRLWDDPFEWTLPEKLSTADHIVNYLDEVEATRKKGFAYFSSDADLQARIPAPERLTSIAEILVATLDHAAHFQGRAFVLYQLMSDGKLPKL